MYGERQREREGKREISTVFLVTAAFLRRKTPPTTTGCLDIFLCVK